MLFLDFQTFANPYKISYLPQQFLYFLPEPQGQASFLFILDYKQNKSSFTDQEEQRVKQQTEKEKILMSVISNILNASYKSIVIPPLCFTF